MQLILPIYRHALDGTTLRNSPNNKLALLYVKIRNNPLQGLGQLVVNLNRTAKSLAEENTDLRVKGSYSDEVKRDRIIQKLFEADPLQGSSSEATIQDQFTRQLSELDQRTLTFTKGLLEFLDQLATEEIDDRQFNEKLNGILTALSDPKQISVQYHTGFDLNPELLSHKQYEDFNITVELNDGSQEDFTIELHSEDGSWRKESLSICDKLSPGEFYDYVIKLSENPEIAQLLDDNNIIDLIWENQLKEHVEAAGGAIVPD